MKPLNILINIILLITMISTCMGAYAKDIEINENTLAVHITKHCALKIDYEIGNMGYPSEFVHKQVQQCQVDTLKQLTK